MDFMMSLEQLDELWKYEFKLCAVLTGLPLRACAANVNSEVAHLFPAMSPERFRQLKQDILQMWVRAAHYFRFRNVPGKGWGVFLPANEDEGFPSTGHLSSVKGQVMGWLARAPTEMQCATGHRYLRSPVEPNFYLGGPISLVNKDDVSRISVNMPFNKTSTSRGLVTVLKLRSLPACSELLWSYNCRSTSSATFIMHSYDAWFKQCCSEETVPNLLSVDGLHLQMHSPPASGSSQEAPQPPAKKSKHQVGGIRPLKKKNVLPRFCWCTYCGVNLDVNKQYAPKLKQHIALNHAQDIVGHLGRNPVDPENPMDPKEYVLHVDMIDLVMEALHHSNISHQPACSFLKHGGEEVKLDPAVPIEEEKERVFQLFKKESAEAFKKYQVVYLKGFSIPTKYEDLLKSKENTPLDSVVWCGNKPCNTNFSINTLGLSDEEKDEHRSRILCALTEIVASYELAST